ncbi:MAG TPA: acetate/propionate family kinase [Methyloceanibacter sp.]
MISDSAILVINCGSSSVKFALFADGEPLARLLAGTLERIGLADGRFRAIDKSGNTVVDETRAIPDHAQALRSLLDLFARLPSGVSLVAVGHRVVHGGADCDCPVLVDDALLSRLRRLIPLAPLHLPHNLAGIAAVRGIRRDLPQVACFDTAFHHSLPRLARLTGLPRSYADEGIHRYGFHGLSYEYVMAELRRRHGPAVAKERIVVAHLGNGASMAAIKDGRSVDTTMGFSTLGGLPMGTRSGDLDPGIILYLLTEKSMTAGQVQQVLYKQSGLLGVSCLSRNMQELLAHVDTEAAAAEAVEFFCYQARKHLAALTATIGGLDRLVFTGGIGANAPLVRAKTLEGLSYLGLDLDHGRNDRNESIISATSSAVVVEAFATNEELMIARHVRHMLAEQRPVARRA